MIGSIGVWGRTVGQRAVGLRVVPVDGARPTWLQAVIRWAVLSGPRVLIVVGRIPRPAVSVAGSWVVLAALWMQWDGQSQTLYDKAAGVVVLRDRN